MGTFAKAPPLVLRLFLSALTLKEVNGDIPQGTTLSLIISNKDEIEWYLGERPLTA